MKLLCSAMFLALLFGMVSCTATNSTKPAAATASSEAADIAAQTASTTADSLSYDPKLIRSWVTRVKNSVLKESREGVKLWSDGVATSINLRNTLYQTWQQNGDNLILKGLKIVNRQKSEITDQFKIVLLTTDTLVLTNSEGVTVGYGYVE